MTISLIRGRAFRTRTAFAVVSIVSMLAAMACVQSEAQSAPVTCSLQNGYDKIAESPGAQILSTSDADLDRELTVAKNMGMWSVRVDVDWSVVEPTRGVRNWAPIDRVINAVVAHGMCPLGLVTYTPIWAARPSDRPTNSHFRPASTATFADFAAAAARRYSATIAVWEIWNEPNLTHYWLPKADSTGYGQLLAAASSAIKTAVPGSSVVSGGLAPAVDNGSDIAPVTFVNRLYQGGFNRSFDALGVHPYTYPALPNDPATSSWSTAQKMWEMHDIMAAGGDGSKPIWMTEFGAPTGTSPVAVSEATQAESFQIVRWAQTDVSWLGPLYVYSVRDAGSDISESEQNFGVVRRDWSPKQAYSVLAPNAPAP